MTFAVPLKSLACRFYQHPVSYRAQQGADSY